jgi:hypothetical protein
MIRAMHGGISQQTAANNLAPTTIDCRWIESTTDRLGLHKQLGWRLVEVPE